MLVRAIQFLLGAALLAGGGYLAWTNRVAAANVFPPGADGMPWLAILGLMGVAAGVTFLVSAVHPRPNRRARLIAESEIREAKLGAAESYYSERSRAADRDWRSGDIPEPAAPAPEPVRVVAPPAAPPPPAPPPPPPPVAAAPAAQPVVAKPVATSAPPLSSAPAQAPFPATATLAPIPAASEQPPPLTKPAPAPMPAAPVAKEVAPAAVTSEPPVAAAAPAAGGPFDAIRAAIAAGQLDAAEKMLNAAREKAEGLALAELTGLAGDHAAAAGRISNAKWLWRLAAKRFGELGAMDTPAAKAVAESLRTAG